jgi:hypothetical protein
MFSPVFENNGSPLLSNDGSIAESNPAQPTGFGRSSMSENGGSVAQGPNAGQKLPSKQFDTGHLRRHSSKSIAANKTLSVQRMRTSETTFDRESMSMHSQANGASMLQNRVGLNSMQMQHGMGAPVSALPGLNVGLNGLASAAASVAAAILDRPAALRISGEFFCGGPSSPHAHFANQGA